MWSEMAIASSWSWVTRTVVTWTSSCSRRSHSRSSARTLASSAPNGSSSSSTFGSTASARASAMRWRWPPESCARVALVVAGEADDAEQLVHPRVDPRLRLLADLQPEGDVVAHRHVLERGVVLEHEPDPALLRRHLGGVGRRGSRRLPLSGTSSPAMMRSSVDLPEPDGPSSDGERPVGDLQRDVVERDEVPERLPDFANGDHASSPRGLIRVMASSVPSAISARSADAA